MTVYFIFISRETFVNITEYQTIYDPYNKVHEISHFLNISSLSFHLSSLPPTISFIVFLLSSTFFCAISFHHLSYFLILYLHPLICLIFLIFDFFPSSFYFSSSFFSLRLLSIVFHSFFFYVIYIWLTVYKKNSKI